MREPLILCLDTSDGGAVGLLCGEDPLGTERSGDARRHTETLTPMIESVLHGAGITPRDLTAIAVGTGPAPFTGLRVGLVTAMTMGRALGIGVHGVCSLDALGYAALVSAGPDAEVLALTDARRREVYWAHYRPAALADGPAPFDVHTLGGPGVDTPAEVASRFPDPIAEGAVVGRGAALYPDAFAAHAVPDALAAVVDPIVLGRITTARLGSGGDLTTAPRYLRRPDIHAAPGRKRAS
ncbi:tRNA (adenosine(37)-N6)-threonylcarbamoyltransferase complex dimerization subunit type 1 TsaB [Occultella glacieicola]|uniref:tRNA (adenosine(37)-N6)-threonylcarbamoyltransferase complex dimerization subunit type 1 TsaB n=1 Tax=Occultella glacieicola TaxID=2518684 RepID=UPI001F2676E6|nr:tRNA (adenosine(37)-N6)-threonylcarbamoyltransferase complex dimerization subunit type 1 TsaB [Occultella glacieicola]